MINLQLYELIGIIMAVGSVVSIFWNSLFKRQGLKREEVEKMIDERAYPLVEGEKNQVEMHELMRKVDKILTNQEILERKLQKMERDFLKQIGQINANLAQLSVRK